jgi:thioredoxin-related protein
MRYFIAFYIFTIYLFAYSHQSERYNPSNAITVDESGEYVIIDEENQVEFEDMSSMIQYMDLKKAKEEAKIEHKFILVKIESSNCPTCNRLNTLLDTNENIKNMVNGYTKAVKLNNDYDNIPPKLEYIGTPTLFLFDSSGKKMLMKLQGSEAIDDIEESLELFIYDNS